MPRSTMISLAVAGVLLRTRTFAVAVTPTGSDGWTGPTEIHVEFITLSRPGTGEPWRVADVQ